MSKQTELAWAAGFFDGEGCVYLSRGSGKYKYPALTLSQNDRRPLERFIEAVGYGKIYGPYKGRPKIHHWTINGKPAEEVFTLLRPYLSEPKIEKFDAVVGEVTQVVL